MFSPSETLDCELLIVSKDQVWPSDHDMVLRCRAEVVRVVRRADRTLFGLGCRLSDYTIGPQRIQRLAVELAR